MTDNTPTSQECRYEAKINLTVALQTVWLISRMIRLATCHPQ